MRARNINEELNEEIIQHYFNLLKTAYEKIAVLSDDNELTVNRIYCMDETAIYLNKHSKYVFAGKGAKNVFSVTSENLEHMTLICYASAAGRSANPYFITPRALPNFPNQSFRCSRVSQTKSGYINETIFTEWTEFFVKEIEKIRGSPGHWCLLIVDGHTTHTMNPKALQVLNDANIMALSLPSHTSSLLQVHDLSIFGP